jgi:hypothetical protein
MIVTLLAAAAALQAAPPSGAPPRRMVLSLDDAGDAATPRLLAMQGMSAAGIAIVQATATVPIDPAPLAAAERRVADTAAAVPLDMATLRLALEVRDSVAAELARARSARLVAVLDRLIPADRAVFLRVYGVGRRGNGAPPGRARP